MSGPTEKNIGVDGEQDNILPPSVYQVPPKISEHEQRQYERADHHELNIEGRRQQLAAKKKMGTSVFRMVAIWLVVVMGTLWMQGSGCFVTGGTFHLSDTVLITLITTTTANVALFLTIVIKHLFPKDGGRA